MRPRCLFLVAVVLATNCGGDGGGGGSGENRAPFADAGIDQQVAVGSLVDLDGSSSSDPDGDAIELSWTFVSKPTGSMASLYNATTPFPTFIADHNGSYVIRLVVDDGMGDSAADTVTVTAVGENVVPVADAGRDQNVTTGSRVTLDGSASSDPDGELITYHWSFTATPTGSIAVLSDPMAVNPSFIADRDGSYRIRLVVNDGRLDSVADSVTVTAATLSSAPVAHAGADQNVGTGSIVTLDGSASSDADGDLLTYRWSITMKPWGSTAVLSSASSARPMFTADRDGSYVIGLVVNDGKLDSATDFMTVIAATLNVPPTAHAGYDQHVTTGSLVTLNGTRSGDPDGDLLTYAWSFTSIPEGSTAVLSSATAAMPTFTADRDGSYVIRLVVSDGTLDSAADFVTVTAATFNSVPVADAGIDRSVFTGSPVTLDGSASSDVDGDVLGYTWSLVVKPEGSAAVLSNADAMRTTFTADRDGFYVLSLVVNDGTVDSEEDVVMITAATLNSAPVANAGPDQNVATGSLVRLGGGASSDANVDELTFAWSFISKPVGSNAVLADATTVSPTFTADRDGNYVVGLVVNDGMADSAVDSVTITAWSINVAPVAYAGFDRIVPTGWNVLLEGGWSSDANGDPLTYAWSFVAKPEGSAAVLASSTTSRPMFKADRDGIYVIALVVHDGLLASDPDSVTITAVTDNTLPWADAGPDQYVATWSLVTLDGSASGDTAGDPLTFYWWIANKPEGSRAWLSSATAVMPTFTPDRDGSYEIRLTVMDGLHLSGADTVVVYATTAP